MQPKIRIRQSLESMVQMDLIWENGDHTFLPSQALGSTASDSTATEAEGATSRTSFPPSLPNPEDFFYFWYISDGSFSTEANASHILRPTTNETYTIGLFMERKGDPDPVVGGMPSLPPKPPVDPLNPDSLQVHVDGGTRGLSPATRTPAMPASPELEQGSLAPLQLAVSRQNGLVVAVIKYQRTARPNLSEKGFLRISFNRTHHPIDPLMLRQMPIAYHDEWTNVAPPARGYRQAIYVGFDGLEATGHRALFVPFWGVHQLDETGTPVLSMEEEIRVDWMEEAEAGASLVIKATEVATS